MAETRCKYYKQKKQVSYDGGQTWQDVIPYEYQKGALYEQQSQDCGYVPPVTQYRWIRTEDTICEGTPEPPSPYESQYFTIVVVGYGQGALNRVKFRISSANTRYYYSTDSGATWVRGYSGTTINIGSIGDKVMFKGELIPTERDGIGEFDIIDNSAFNVEGNIMSLLYGDDFIGKKDLTGKDYAFKYLFNGGSNKHMYDASNLILPATTLAPSCYAGLFYRCTTLSYVPKLPARTLSRSCYASMFAYCNSLTTVPDDLLPATTLVEFCYGAMFYNCRGLTKTPELPAKKLVAGCYSEMFRFCTSLNYVKCLATDVSVGGDRWLSDVASSGTFVTPASTNWSSGVNGIPTGWTRVDA